MSASLLHMFYYIFGFYLLEVAIMCDLVNFHASKNVRMTSLGGGNFESKPQLVVWCHKLPYMPKMRFRNRPVSSINSEHTSKYIYIKRSLIVNSGQVFKIIVPVSSFVKIIEIRSFSGPFQVLQVLFRFFSGHFQFIFTSFRVIFRSYSLHFKSFQIIQDIRYSSV